MDQINNQGNGDNRPTSATQYIATNDRRSKNFEFFWQAVALSLTAQAFLMTIALGGSISAIGRVLAVTLSIFVSCAAISLMASQKRYQKIEAKWLDYFEQDGPPVNLRHNGGIEEREGALREAHASARIAPLARFDTRTPFFHDASTMWLVLMNMFIFVDLVVLLILIFDPTALSGISARTSPHFW